METTPLLNANRASDGQLNRFQYVMVMFSLYFGVYLAALDGTVVSTLLSHIASDLNALSAISWVATSYLVSYSAFQPLYGKISDIYGRKRVLIFCNTVFAIGCAICGLSKGLGVLVLGRFISGVGAGGLLSLSTITISDYVPLKKRGIYQGIGNIAFGIGSATGGIFGSITTDIGGWRLAFNAQVPLCVVGIVTLQLFLEQPAKPTGECLVETDTGVLDEEMRIQSLRDRRRKSMQRRPSQPLLRNSIQRIDLIGSCTLVTALISFMLGINMGGDQFGWTSPVIIAFFGLSMLFLAMFVYWELYRAKEPVLPIRILMHRTIISACITNFFVVGANYAFLFYSPMFLTAAYDFTYTVVAHRLVANFIGVAIGSLGAGYYMAHTGKYHTLGVLSTATMTVGATMFARMPWLADEIASSVWYTSISYLLFGVGYTATLTVCLTALIAAVPAKFQAMTTSAQYTFRGIGSSIGTALAASIFDNTLYSELRKNVQGPDAEEVIHKVSESIEAIHHIPKEYFPSVLWSYKIAGVSVFVFCIGLLLFAILSSYLQQVHEIDKEDVIDDIVDRVSAH